ncbi:hypothetical protein L495_3029 [Bordetella bronchiseptica CARE970018BB]|nr:hypothetical protein AZ15_2545 [Bordetella bronchiseptica A1-7]KDB72944.1 hypothetical protein AZ21_2425 [Bordetella bronchiseptica B20-10725633]KDB79428.1 hypothetical protein L495_3029 [Bordetella bronchiseptica CARE970018BB]KDC42345.1 hypothetical protein L508_2318 [Bordetella bronchiseptica M435/02/3]KDC45687.1 hypothetical protein L509_2326 [Bordetella bronchiseptica M85/00/2]KDC56645.1 hypothetical protein L511_2307 [Bordetella bronchiseptica MBORD595]KDC78513.1 hypothetical protein 
MRTSASAGASAVPSCAASAAAPHEQGRVVGAAHRTATQDRASRA